MTDRGEQALGLSRDTLQIGPSAMVWKGDSLEVQINEISTPHAQRVKGTVTIHPSAVTDQEMLLSDDGAHVWRPFAPTARIEVKLNRPGWTWSGHGYFDANFGTRALEADFNYWTWGRFPLRDGSACFYDLQRRDGTMLETGIGFKADGTPHAIPLPPRQRMRRPGWMVRRDTFADAGFKPHQVKAMLDAPFYNRCAIKTKINGEETVGVYEALDLDRLRGPWLMPMLAVRVPRRRSWPGG